MANINPGIYTAAVSNLCTLPVDHPAIEQSLALLERLCAGRRHAQAMASSLKSAKLQDVAFSSTGPNTRPVCEGAANRPHHPGPWIPPNSHKTPTCNRYQSP